jgi:hypothetical protein
MPYFCRNSRTFWFWVLKTGGLRCCWNGYHTPRDEVRKVNYSDNKKRAETALKPNNIAYFATYYPLNMKFPLKNYSNPLLSFKIPLKNYSRMIVNYSFCTFCTFCFISSSCKKTIQIINCQIFNIKFSLCRFVSFVFLPIHSIKTDKTSKKYLTGIFSLTNGVHIHLKNISLYRNICQKVMF